MQEREGLTYRAEILDTVHILIQTLFRYFADSAKSHSRNDWVACSYCTGYVHVRASERYVIFYHDHPPAVKENIDYWLFLFPWPDRINFLQKYEQKK